MDTVIINYQYNLIRTHSRIKHFIIVHNHILYNDKLHKYQYFMFIHDLLRAN